MKIVNQLFDGKDVILDGNVYEDCVFKACRLHFSGREGCGLKGCDFGDCQWHFHGPAATTLSFIRAFAASNESARQIVLLSLPGILEAIPPRVPTPEPEVAARPAVATPETAAIIPPPSFWARCWAFFRGGAV